MPCRYEESILALEDLTPHQKDSLAQCERAGERADVHVRAPAGAGKTFVALHLMRGTLDASKAGRILFVARNPALCEEGFQF